MPPKVRKKKLSSDFSDIEHRMDTGVCTAYHCTKDARKDLGDGYECLQHAEESIRNFVRNNDTEKVIFAVFDEIRRNIEELREEITRISQDDSGQ